MAIKLLIVTLVLMAITHENPMCLLSIVGMTPYRIL